MILYIVLLGVILGYKMVEKCIICSSEISEEFGKLEGTIIKAKNEKVKNDLLYVCSDCQKQDDWIEKAKVKGT